MNRIQWTAAAALSLPMLAFGSSHREAPAIARSPALDGTDFYIFNSYEANRAGYVTILANYNPLQDPFGGPNYFAMDPAGLYEIMIDSDGDAKEDLTFQFRFTNTLANGNKGIQLPVGPAGSTVATAIPLKNAGAITAADNSKLNFIENYSLTMITGDRRTGAASPINNAAGNATFTKPMDYIGQKSFGTPDAYAAYAGQYVYTVNLPIPNCSTPGRVFVGQRKEGFSVNLGEAFDLVNNVPIEGDSAPGAGDGGGFPGGITQSPLHNVLRNKNITTLALELPISCIKGKGNGVVGAWTTASVRQVRVLNPNANFAKTEVNGGAYTQVSRLSAPLVNELVIGIPDKDHFNSSSPSGDGQFLAYVTNPSLPELLNALFLAPVNATLGTTLPTLAPTNFPRNDLVAAFLTGFKGVNQMATVTPSEMLRLNTGVPAVAATAQSSFGVVGNDLAGFPNGRRPGDNVVDLSLRVVMGALCYPIPVAGVPTNLGICAPADAAVGNVAFTDGAPISAADFDVAFPYLKTPLPGSPVGAQGN